jgi:uncharacterized protein
MGYRSRMPLSADPRPAPNVVVGYSATEVRLRDRRITSSALITPAAVADWTVRSVAALDLKALEPLLALGADVVLLATGARQEFPAPVVLGHAAAAGVGLEVMDVGAACRTYNVLVAEDRAVALALILPGAAAD